MNDVIRRATDSINQILETMPQWDIFTVNTKTRLIDTCDLLNRLIEFDSSETDQVRLFCRYLKRLMDYNDSLSTDFWQRLRNDLLCLLEKSNDGNRKNLFRKINIEKDLEQRELQVERNNFNVLLDRHERNFLDEYLQKCISFHSTIEIHGLIDDIDDLLGKIGSSTYANRQEMQEKLKSIKIPIRWSYRSFNSLNSESFTNDDPDSFLPSQQIDMESSDEIETIEEILECHRWIVILGDPGSAKTTLLRWLTYVFAKAARRHRKEVTLKDGICLPVRIPILVRIGEFAEWLNQHPTKTLFDYIGEHTWFAKSYCHVEDSHILKEMICHGRTLILLDGLDEISDVGQRADMVDLVEKFIDEYVRAPDFISAFDDRMFYGEIIETQSPNQPGGNQIIVTSRIVGYQFRPLNSSYVQHYTLALMNHEEANKFVNNWLQSVSTSLEKIFLSQKTLKISFDEAIFENCSELLRSNSALLSLICLCIFQSMTEFHPKTRVEVYDRAVQTALRIWNRQQPNISEKLVKIFLIDLASYLHLKSSSGLIDAFDIHRLCCISLQRQQIFNNREQLQQYAKQILFLLDSNTAIASEKGLQVFGFQHLSFQEYFVAQSLVEGSDVIQIAKRILSFTVNSRFRESLLLAFGWISWKWSRDQYDRFCHFLVTQIEDYVIPFGIFLFIDGIKDAFQLPSTSIIFLALNNLLNHPSDIIRSTYFISNLSKLPDNLIIEWMELYLKDDRSLLQFCRCFPLKNATYNDTSITVRKQIPSVIYRQLCSFHQRNPSTEFLRDQILRRVPIFDDETEQIFNQNLIICNMHPLILSVIIAVCGGIYVIENSKDVINMNFSLKHMFRQTSIIEPIIEYLINIKDSHLIKVQILIEQYENVLKNTSPTESSPAIVDTLIALICLRGVSQLFIYRKYATYQALPIALEKLKQTWFYLKELCNPSPITINRTLDVSSIISTLDPIVRSQSLPLSIACACAWKKLDLWHVSNRRSIEGFSSPNRIDRYFHCQPDFLHFIGKNELENIAKQIHLLPLPSDKIVCALPFLPQSLQPLYHCMIVTPASFLPVILLSECLLCLEVADKDDFNLDLALPTLQSMLKEYMLENYALALKREIFTSDKLRNTDREAFRKAMNKHKLFDSFKNQPKSVKLLIEIERQRIRDSKATLQNHEKDVRLFAASISLARIFQVRYRYYSRKYSTIPRKMSIDLDESKEICFTLTNISDRILRTVALSMIFDMKDPMIFHEEQRDYLRWEMINLLESQLSDLSLLTSTLLFVRCYSAYEFFPTSFQNMAHIIGQKLNESINNSQSQEQQAAYIALQQLDNSDLSNYLSNFSEQQMNLSDLLHFNSTILHHYLTTTTSSTCLLSTMYLAELAFDAQILKIYSRDNQQQHHVLPIPKTIMTSKLAMQITTYLQNWDANEIQQIIDGLYNCQLIERNALLEMQKWLDYRLNKQLRFFAYYAALQLISEGSNSSNLMEIIHEMFDIDKKLRLAPILTSTISSSVVDLTILRQILIKLQSNACFSSKICSWISRKETLELILNFEQNQPFLSMIRVYSTDLLIYLNNHIRTLIDEEIRIDKINSVAVVIKWIIESSIWYPSKTKFPIELYEFIFELLLDRQFPQIQKTIMNALSSIFFHPETNEDNIFIQESTMISLEKLIYSWNTYSEDILANCLLAHGNYLSKLLKLELIFKISNEIKTILTILFETSLSEIISIRAGFCLIFTEHTNVKFETIINWFTDKWNINPIKKSHVVLQQTLFHIYDRWAMLDHLEMDSFVEELYNYLRSKDNSNYLSDPEPNYLNIAVQIIDRNVNKFRDAIQKRFFDEDEFKSELYFRFQNIEKDRKSLIRLYSCFDTLTDEFIDMLQWFKDDEYGEISLKLENLKNVYDRDVIDKLFAVIDLKLSQGDQCNSCLQVLRRLVEMNAITMVELNQRFSHMNNLLHNNNNDNHDWQEDILELFVGFSCFKTDLLVTSTKRLFTQNNIEEEFQRARKYADINSSLIQ